jgi:hypothetical protein
MQMSKKQRETIELLQSQIDDMEICESEYAEDKELVFEGAGVDGPAIGYIEFNGKVTWVAGG